jgi:hypothetical protein
VVVGDVKYNMKNHNIIHENIIYFDHMPDISLCDYTRDTVTLISKQDFIVWDEHEPTYTSEEFRQLNVCDLIIQPD